MIQDFFSALRSSLGLDAARSDLDTALEIADSFGLPRSEIEFDLAELVKERILMQLVGNVPGHLNFGERRNFVARRLAILAKGQIAYSPLPTAPEVEALTLIQQAISNAGAETRDSVSSLDERSARDLLAAQGYRCSVCGVPFRIAVRKSCEWFADGFEPLCESFHLDHIIPYYLLGNEGGRRILCERCNTIKNDRIGVQEDGFVVAGNHIRRRDESIIRRRMVFWTLAKTNRCQQQSCASDSSSDVLLVEIAQPDYPFMYGNLIVKCPQHAERSAIWIHGKS